MQRNHTLSPSSTSLKDFSWSLQAMISGFIRQDKSSTAKRMKDDGLRTSQIARYLYGEADKQTISKVCKLLKEVK